MEDSRVQTGEHRTVSVSDDNLQKVVTHGIFSIDGEDFAVDNNIWIVGDDREVVVIDAAHEAAPIVAAVGARRVAGILCTHGHNDHINVAVELAEALDAPVALHPDDRMLWDTVHPDHEPHVALAEGQRIKAGGVTLVAMHTPGHSPGGVSFYDSTRSRVFAGDTLFRGGPGATGRSFSSFPTIIESIRTRLLTLPSGTVVHTGHGDDTTIADEAPHLDEWIARGH
jgi:glyoxylase-like metal-dependent hydrolase (beta-lactamase superfamily II)